MSKSFFRIKDWPQGLPKEPVQDDSWRLEIDEYYQDQVDAAPYEAADLMAEESMAEVYILENTWTQGFDDDEGHANLSVHVTEEGAKDALWATAQDVNFDGLGEDDTSFSLDDGDTYFINRYILED